MSSDQRAIARSIRSMTIGSIERARRTARAYEQEGLNELDQMFQIPVEGNAVEAVSWTDLELKFDAPLLDAPENRRTPYSDPTFTCGVVTSGRVVIVPNVALWQKTDEGTVTGVLMRIGVYAPGNRPVLGAPTEIEEAIPFKGEVHLNFQGYGAMEDETGDDGG